MVAVTTPLGTGTRGGFIYDPLTAIVTPARDVLIIKHPASAKSDALVLKLAPVMVTTVPAGPNAGEKALMAGCARQLNDTQIKTKKRTNPFLRVWDSDLGNSSGPGYNSK